VSDDARPIVIEVAGPAGAGKSAVVAALTARDPTILAFRHLRKSASLWLLSKHAVATLKAAPSIVADSPLAAWTVTRFVARLGVLRDLVRHETEQPWKAIVLDEGPLYTLAMLRARVRNGHLVAACERALAEWAGTLDLIVWLDAADSVLAHRIRSRAKDHEVKDREMPVISEYLARHRAWLGDAAARLTAQPGVRLLTFRTEDESPDRLAERVLGAVGEAGSHAGVR
jgi:broad-specificity NMP kinase